MYIIKFEPMYNEKEQVPSTTSPRPLVHILIIYHILKILGISWNQSPKSENWVFFHYALTGSWGLFFF